MSLPVISCVSLSEENNPYELTTFLYLVALPSHQILTVNKRLLDPRRPTSAPTKEDQEEQLIPYAPIPEERKMFLTYNLEVRDYTTFQIRD